MWQKAQEVLTAEEIATAGATGAMTVYGFGRSTIEMLLCIIEALLTSPTHVMHCFAGVPTNNASQALGTVVTDESLGALMRHMEELGVLDNTVIIVKADHGVIEKSSVIWVPDLLFMIDVVHLCCCYSKTIILPTSTSP